MNQSMIRVQRRLGQVDNGYCPQGTIRSGNSCYATTRDRIYNPPSGGGGSSSGGGWSGTVAQLGSQALALLSLRLQQGNYQPFQTTINGRNYLVQPNGTAQDLGASVGGAFGGIGQSFSNFVQANPLLTLGVVVGGILLFMKPPSRRGR